MIKCNSACKIHHTHRNAWFLAINWYNGFLCCRYLGLESLPLFQWPRIRKLLRCYRATIPQSNTRPLEVQTAKVQVPCWAMLGQSSLYITPSLRLSLSLPPWWLMANAALVHLYIPPHPSLANRCEILDMAWIWPPGERRGGGWIGLEGNFHLPQHPYHFWLSSSFILPLLPCLHIP